MGRRDSLLLSLIAAVLTLALYGVTVRYGFYYDDYHFVRPYPAADVLAAFHGPWDAAGIELPYFRPLTISLFAARFSIELDRSWVPAATIPGSTDTRRLGLQVGPIELR